MFKNKTPRILAVTAGLPAKRNPLVMALHDKYGAQVQAGKRFQDNRLDRYLRKLNLAGLIGTHAKNLRSLNHEILKRAGHFDILFIVKGNFVYAKTLKKLKQMSIPPLIVGWSPDDVYLPHNNSKVLLDSAPYFDVFFTAKSLNISNGELSSIGFKDARFLKQGFDFRQMTPEDLLKFGLIPEFIGRLPMIATLEDLDEKSLIKILQEPKNSLTKQYQELFKLDGAKLTFKENALKEIAQKAIKKKTGARGLRSILENILLKTMYDLPSQDNIEEVIVDAGAAKGQSQPILVHAKGDNKSKSNKPSAA